MAHNRFDKKILKTRISYVLTNKETNIELFEIVLCSYLSHLPAVRMLMVVILIVDYVHPNIKKQILLFDIHYFQ